MRPLPHFIALTTLMALAFLSGAEYQKRVHERLYQEKLLPLIESLQRGESSLLPFEIRFPDGLATTPLSLIASGTPKGAGPIPPNKP